MPRSSTLSPAHRIAASPVAPRRRLSWTRHLRWAVDRPPLVVGAIVLVSAAVAAVFSLQVARFEPDELGYTHLALGIAHSFSPVTTEYGGGERLNQLYPLLISPLWGLFGNVTAFRLSHAWNALLMASAAVPAYLLAREVVKQRWAAYLAAALVAAAPWLTLSTGQLTEVATYPACAWALLAMQRALSLPSAKRDGVALLAIAVATYGRQQMIMLAPVFVLAMLVHELGYGLRADRPKVTLAEARQRILRGHLLLVVVTAIAVLGLALLVATGKLDSVAGFYRSTVDGVTLNGATFDLARSYFAFMALGLGVLPVALAVGFVLETFVAPGSRRTHAFASLAIVAVVAIVLQVAEVSVRLTGGSMQERYVFYVVPLLVVGMCASLLSTRHPAKLMLAGTVAVALLVGTTHYESLRTAFWYQTSPGMASFYDWIRPFFGASGSPMSDPGASRLVVAGVVILVLGVSLSWLARTIAPTRLLAGVGVVVVVFCIAETTHALWRVVHGNSSGGGFGGSLTNADWVDKHVPVGSDVGQLVASVGGIDSTQRLWEDNEFWNRSIKQSYALGFLGDPYLPSSPLAVDEHSGSLTLREASSTSPRRGIFMTYVVLPSHGFPIEIAGRVLARSSDGRLQLMRVTGPLRVAWSVSGISSDGWLELDRPATIQLYSLKDAPGRCLKVTVSIALSQLETVPSRLRLVAGGRLAAGALLRPGERDSLAADVCGKPAGIPVLQIFSRRVNADLPTSLSPRVMSVSATSP